MVAGYHELTGMSPDGAEEWKFLLSIATIQHLQARAAHRFRDAFHLEEILGGPASVHEARLEEEYGYQTGYYYIGVPDLSKRRDGILPPPRPNQVYVVTVAVDRRGNIILDWEWVETSPERPDLPRDRLELLGRQTWPKT